MTARRRPRATSLRAKLRAFFDANPGEELTRADIAAKFDAGESTVDSALRRMRINGELEAAHVWRLKQKGA